jgi:hypothetical protein
MKPDDCPLTTQDGRSAAEGIYPQMTQMSADGKPGTTGGRISRKNTRFRIVAVQRRADD